MTWKTALLDLPFGGMLQADSCSADVYRPESIMPALRLTLSVMQGQKGELPLILKTCLRLNWRSSHASLFRHATLLATRQSTMSCSKCDFPFRMQKTQEIVGPYTDIPAPDMNTGEQTMVRTCVDDINPMPRYY